jgi:hypothetical protein
MLMAARRTPSVPRRSGGEDTMDDITQALDQAALQHDLDHGSRQRRNARLPRAAL